MNKKTSHGFSRFFTLFLMLCCMMASFTGCERNKASISEENRYYDMDKDMLFLNGQVFTIHEVQVVSDLLYDCLNEQYSDIFSNPATLQKPCFTDHEMTLLEYEKEYSLYKELLFLACFSQCYDNLELDFSWEFSQKLADKTKAQAFYEKHYEKGTNTSITKEECEHVFELYTKAFEYQELQKKKLDLVISDEEVRVVACEVARCKDYSSAAEFLKNLENGGDFSLLSSKINELDHTSFYITRSSEEFPKDVLDQLFACQSNERCKEVYYASDKGYYVYHVTDMFHEKLSKQNREKKLTEKLFDYYDTLCKDFLDHSTVFFNQRAWEELK